jgi:uncharacterized protein with von Willebrand factor type A (vWA) domain
MMGVWSHVSLKKAVAPLKESGHLTPSQAIVYAYPANTCRHYLKNDNLMAAVASAHYLTCVDQDQAFNHFQARKIDASISYLDLRVENLRERKPKGYKAKLKHHSERRKRLVKKKDWWNRKVPALSLLNDQKVECYPLKSKPVVTASLSLLHSSKTRKVEHDQDVKIPYFDESMGVIRTLRECAKRSLKDMILTIQVMKKFEKEFGPISDRITKEETEGQKEGKERTREEGPSKDESNSKEGNNSKERKKNKGKGGDSNTPKQGKQSNLPSGTGAGSGVGSNTERVNLIELVLERPEVFDKILMYMQEIETLIKRKPSKKVSENATLATTYSYGNDLEQVVPSELGLLAKKETKLEFLARLANNSLLMTAPTANKRSPVALCIDCSGSMSGSFYEMAAAFTLVMVRHLYKDKRGVALITFSGNVEKTLVIDRNEKFSLAKVLEVLSEPSLGGTHFDPPILKAQDIRDEQRWQNITTILITDGYGIIARPEEILQRKRIGDNIIAGIVSKVTTLQGVDMIYHIDKGGDILKLAQIANTVL